MGVEELHLSVEVEGDDQPLVEEVDQEEVDQVSWKEVASQGVEVVLVLVEEYL